MRYLFVILSVLGSVAAMGRPVNAFGSVGKASLSPASTGKFYSNRQLVLAAQLDTNIRKGVAAKPKPATASQKADNAQRATAAALANRTVHASLSSIRAFKGAAPKAFYLIDRDKGGIFAHDSLDSSSPDDGAVTLVDGSKRRYKRKFDGPANLIWWGAKGDNSANDSAAVQRAIRYVCSAARPTSGELPTYSGNPGTLICPVGTFRVANIKIPGSIRIIGQGGGTYASTTFVQSRPGANIFMLEPDVDGLSNSTIFENIALKSGSRSRNPNVAQIKVRAGLSSNSLYFRNVWFKSPENLGVDIPQGDDIQFTDCKADVAPFDVIRLGSAKGRVTNARITGMTFYRVANAAIRLVNVRGLTISNNVFYTNDDGSFNVPNGICIDGLNAADIDAVSITGNTVNNVPDFIRLPTLTRTVSVVSNTLTNVNGTFINLFGGAVAYGWTIVGNSVSTSPKSGFATAPITGAGCGLQGSTIMGNSFFSGKATALGINLPDSRVFSNVISGNTGINITNMYSLTNLALNGQLLPDAIGSLKTGDLFYYDGTKLHRIGIGANGQSLKVVGGVPAWSN
ncbi:hypothetical protein [Spirosoma fluminis]